MIFFFIINMMNTDWKTIRKFTKENKIDRIYVYDNEILLAEVEDGFWTGVDDIDFDIMRLYLVKDSIKAIRYLNVIPYSHFGSLLFPRLGTYSYHPSRNCYDCLCWYWINSDHKLTKSRAHFERATETKKMDTFHIVDIRIMYNFT